jgi:hypothetical protein
MRQKIGRGALSVALVCLFVPTVAFGATETTTEIGNTAIRANAAVAPTVPTDDYADVLAATAGTTNDTPVTQSTIENASALSYYNNDAQEIVTLNQDIDSLTGSGIIIYENSDVVIDLAGHAIENADASIYSIYSAGKCTIKDSVGGGKIEGVGNVICVDEGTFVIEGGTIASSGYATIIVKSEGTLEVDGGTISSPSICISATDGATVDIKDGDVKSTTTDDYCVEILDGATLNMTGGEVTNTSDGGAGILVATQSADKTTVANISGGTVTANYAVQVYSTSTDSSVAYPVTLNVSGSAVLSGTPSSEANPGTGVSVQGAGAAVNVTGGIVEGTVYGIAGNGTVGRGGTIVDISGGAITQTGTSEGAAVYLPQEGACTISSGDLTGTTGVEVISGTLKVTGGTITGTGEALAKDGTSGTYSEGVVPTGSAVTVIERTGYTNGAKVELSGGTMNSDKAEAVTAFAYDGTTVTDWAGAKDALAVTGGQYSDNSGLAYVPDGYTMKIESNGEWVVAKDAASTETETETTTTITEELVEASTSSESELAQTGDTMQELLAVASGGMALAVISMIAAGWIIRRRA